MIRIIDTLSRVFKKRGSGELKVLTDSIDHQLQTVGGDISKLNLQYIIATSTGEWLDEWGSWFGIERLPDEEDFDYAHRMLAIASKPKNTIPAFQESIRAYLGDGNIRVIIYEPFEDILKFSENGNLSDGGMYQDADYFRIGVVDISVATEITDILRDTIEQIRSAGVKVYFTKLNELGYITEEIVKMAPESDEQLSDTEVAIELLSSLPSDGTAIFSENWDLPLSGDQVLFQQLQRYVELLSEYGEDKLSRLTLALVEKNLNSKYAEGRTLAIFIRERQLSTQYGEFHSIPGPYIKETNMGAVLARMILAGSHMHLYEIADKTIAEVSNMRDHSTGDVQVTTLPV